jgi:outer membrane protein TolC
MSFSIEAKTYSLKDLISSIDQHPEVLIDKLEIEKAHTYFDKIDGETGPKVNFLLGAGPNKSARGNAQTYTESSSVDTYTLLSKIDFKWPLFMFNRSGDLKKAATLNKEIKILDNQKKKAELLLKLKEYYFGAQYAFSLNDFAESTLKDLDEAISSMKTPGNSKTESIDQLTYFRSLAQVKKIEIEKSVAQAYLGLKYITQDAEVVLSDEYLEQAIKPLPSLGELKAKLQKTNFDLKKAELGFEAKSAFYESEKKSRLPVFGLFSSYEWKKTPDSQKQVSPFSYDPYHQSDFSVGLGLIWEFDWGSKTSQVDLSRIERDIVEKQKAFATQNLPIKLEKLYLDCVSSSKKAIELEKAYKLTKRVFNKKASSIALGMSPAKEIIESYTKKAEAFSLYLEAVYEFEKNLAALSYEVGEELDPTLLKTN